MPETELQIKYRRKIESLERRDLNFAPNFSQVVNFSKIFFRASKVCNMTPKVKFQKWSHKTLHIENPA